MIDLAETPILKIFATFFLGLRILGFFQTLPGEAGVTSINIHLTACIQVRLQLRGEIWGPTTPTTPNAYPQEKWPHQVICKFIHHYCPIYSLDPYMNWNVCEEILPLLVLKFKVQTRPCKERCQGNLLSRWSPWFCGLSALREILRFLSNEGHVMTQLPGNEGGLHTLFISIPFWMITWQQSSLDVSVCDCIYAL